MTTFVDDIPGVRELQWEDSSPVPQRSLLSFIGAVVVQDNEADGCTELIFAAPTAAGVTASAAVTVDVPSFTSSLASAPLATVSLLRLTASAARTIHGLEPTARPRIVLANVGGVPIVIAHNSAGAPAATHRFLCPNGVSYTLDSNRCVEAVRDTIDGRWRLVG